MHELSVVTSIVKTAQQEVEKINGIRVVEIYLEIGKLSGVEMDSFHFIWPQCIHKSVLEFATLFIDETVGKAKCIECGEVFSVEKIFDNCPKCNSPFKEILSGKELKIKKLIIK
ncbi:hydrogenase maturation nickel metallochaperone HypA [Flavobacterium sp.]|uniref:hydrogenase maturation nickel metallochaperone HypA/HybF n=1 Tax=Flavobacterium sp. TaxID=239 RepID=UPI0025C5D15E|nr:hydrogenase maturation nickel metallochaperone HypA [Flavobacterium sp.]MBA4154741.1 hydrogenase expression protein [Flavobacterium sp.]